VVDVDLLQGLQNLRDAASRDDVLNAVWDLRDSAYDRPQSWSVLTAETFLQALAEAVEDAPADDREWQVANRLLARALEKVLVSK
jgi:hypothetical protein